MSKPKRSRKKRIVESQQQAKIDSNPPPIKKDKKSQVSGAAFFGVTLGFIAIASIAGYFILGIGGGDSPIGDDPKNNELVGNGVKISNKDGLTRVATHKSWEEMDNASADGWQTEAFSDQANHQLKELGKLLSKQGQANQKQVESLITNDFDSGLLRPEEIGIVFEDKRVTVERTPEDPPVSIFGDSSFKGPAGFDEALAQFKEPFKNAKDVRFKFKLFRVEPKEGVNDEVVTRQYLGMSGSTPDGMLEQNSTWIATWKTDGDLTSKKYPKIKSLSVKDFEQIRTKATHKTLFTDCTESALSKNESFTEHLLKGYNYWLDRTETRPYWARLGTPGVALADVNGDGLEDVYLCQERGLPNLLFLQNKDGTLTDISDKAGVNWLEDCRSALFIDLDNDGDQDLAVGVTGGLLLAENDGDASFKIRKVMPITDDVKSLSSADYDNDGRLDIYATAYYPNVFEGGDVDRGDLAASRVNQAIYDVNNGGSNTLYKNEIEDGNWNFKDVTKEVGLDENNARYSLAAATWEDFDNDGDQDLYVANDYGLNCFFRNDDGKFTDIALDAKVEDKNFSMSSTWADFDRDGWMDLYVGNMFSAAGNRVTYQQMFKPGVTEEERAKFQYMARGNSMFKNNADGTFDDITLKAGVNIGRWAWSTNFVDLNNDGWQDLVVANGMITTENTGDC